MAARRAGSGVHRGARVVLAVTAVLARRRRRRVPTGSATHGRQPLVTSLAQRGTIPGHGVTPRAGRDERLNGGEEIIHRGPPSGSPRGLFGPTPYLTPCEPCGARQREERKTPGVAIGAPGPVE